jgi:hypothetical protein
MTAGMTELEWVVALQAIKTLKARRIRALDTKDWATYEALHAEDHVSHNEGEPRYEGTKVNTARLSTLLHKGIVTVHHAHTPEIELTAPDKATGIWAMEDNLYWKQDGEDHWLRGFGFYHESYAKRDGRWQFTSRQLRRTKVLTSPGGDMSKADADPGPVR